MVEIRVQYASAYSKSINNQTALCKYARLQCLGRYLTSVIAIAVLCLKQCLTPRKLLCNWAKTSHVIQLLAYHWSVGVT